MKSLAVTFLCVLIALTGLATMALGQATDGNIVGTIVDASGAAVPNATVEAVNPATGVKHSTTANALGQYRFNNVQIGHYNITASAKGFATATTAGALVELNLTTAINFTLQVGQVKQQVEVTEATVPIDTTTAQIASTYTAQMAVDLPQAANPFQGLGVLNLSLLGAGVASTGGVGVGEGPSVGGQRPRENNFMIDGVDNNRKDVTGPTVSVNNEAVAEFSVLQNQFSAEFGHSSAGQFNIITKSGTNEIHGSVFEYLQNRDLNAVDQQFARQGILSNPRFDENSLGATIGGPIIKNKLFYFGNFTYIPEGEASTPSAAYAPTAAGYQQLAAIPGVSKTNLDVLQTYMPAPNGPVVGTTPVGGVNIPLAVFPIVAPSYQNKYNWLLSVDFNQSDKDNWRFRYIDNNNPAIDNAASLPQFFQSEPTTSKLASASEYHTFGPTLTNEVRLSYSRYNNSIPAGNFTFPGLDSFPNLEILNDLGVQIGPDPNAPQETIFNNYQALDNVSWTKGKHTLKFGIEARKLIAPETFIQRQRGDYDYNTLNQYIMDLSPDNLAERNVGAAPYSGNQGAIYSYVNDNWRVSRNLSVNLGVRYEFTSVPFTMRQQSLESAASVPGVLSFTQPQPDKKDWAPRVGLAYSPGGSGNTSIRAGFGMSYDVVFDNIGLLSVPAIFTNTVDTPNLNGTNSNFLAQGGITPCGAIPSFGIGCAASGANLTGAQIRSIVSAWIPPEIQTPYAINWTTGIQHLFKKDYTLEIRYVGTKGVHLPTQSRINRVTNVTPTNSIPTYLTMPSTATLGSLPLTLGQLKAEPTNILAPYGFDSSAMTAYLYRGNSEYHGLDFDLSKRFAHDFLFKGAYTWSHDIDDSTAEVFSTYLSPRRPQDFYNLSAEKAASALDHRQRLTLSWVYDAPWFKGSHNWFAKNLLGNYMLSGTYTAESPEYATVQSSADANLNGDAAGDRAIINTAGSSNVGSGVTAFNAAGQQVPIGSASTVAYVANNPNARYITAQQGAFANGGRNTLPLRGINNFDLSLMKNFNITERVKFQFRSDWYNAFNHPQFTPGQINNVYLTSNISSNSILVPSSSSFNDQESFFASNARTIQLDARLTW
jgi:hypothetical protein